MHNCVCECVGRAEEGRQGIREALELRMLCVLITSPPSSKTPALGLGRGRHLGTQLQ